MMKRFLCKILFFFFVMLMLPLFSLTARAEDYGAELNSLHFDIELQEDGSAYITETREIVFTGDHEFTRYGVNNIFSGPRVFSDWLVSIDGTIISQLDEPDNENRPENTFAVEDNDEGNTVYIYFRQQSSGTRIFQISYCVENAVKLYSDVGEFYWNLTAEKGISDIGTLTATLTVPEGIQEEDFRIWAHGPLNGTFEKDSSYGFATLQADNVPLGTIVDIRATLPADCFYGGWEQQGEALDKILAEEKELADSANAKREEDERERAKREVWEEKHPILYSIQEFCQSVRSPVQNYLEEHGAAWFILCVFLFFFSYGVFSKLGKGLRRIKMKRFRKQPAQSPKYYRYPPDNRPAPVVDRLVHFYDGKSDISRQITATLLELGAKKLVHFQSSARDTELLLNEQLGEELFFHTSRETAESAPEYSPDYQEALWDFLCNAANGSGRISMMELKKYIKDNQEDALKFRKNFEGAVEKEYTERVKSENKDKHSSGWGKRCLLFAGAVGILTMLIWAFSTLYDGVQIGDALLVGFFTFLAVISILGLICFEISIVKEESACRILDQQGENDLALWQAFERFLNDFATLEDKELSEFSVWPEYMVYAVAMGNGRKVAKALTLKYPEAFTPGRDVINDDIYRMMQDKELYDAMDSIGREVAEVREPSSSSDWGDGGGFSDSGGGSDSGSGGDFID